MATKNKKAKKSNNFSTVFTILLSMVLVAVIAFGIFVLVNDPTNPENEDNKKDTVTTDVKKELKNNTDDNIDVDVDTDDDEITDTETVYDDEKVGYESENQEKPVAKDADGKKVANTTLSITQADSFYILSGRVTNFKEEGGSCFYVLTNNGNEKRYSKPVIPDAKNTVCEAIKLDKSELGSGEWKVWVEYSSNNAKGSSEAQIINL